MSAAAAERDFDCCALGLHADEAEAYVEATITEALTPEVLSRLAFKGVTSTQARTLLRAKVAGEVRREFRLADLEATK